MGKKKKIDEDLRSRRVTLHKFKLLKRRIDVLRDELQKDYLNYPVKVMFTKFMEWVDLYSISHNLEVFISKGKKKRGTYISQNEIIKFRIKISHDIIKQESVLEKYIEYLRDLDLL